MFFVPLSLSFFLSGLFVHPPPVLLSDSDRIGAASKAETSTTRLVRVATKSRRAIVQYRTHTHTYTHVCIEMVFTVSVTGGQSFDPFVSDRTVESLKETSFFFPTRRVVKSFDRKIRNFECTSECKLLPFYSCDFRKIVNQFNHIFHK